LITLQRLKKLGARILRNDQDGEVACQSLAEGLFCR